MKTRSTACITVFRISTILLFLFANYISISPAHATPQKVTDPITDWNTFAGSSNEDKSNCIALDSSGNIYIAGYSDATWGSPVRAYSGNTDAFAAKLDNSGNLVWNTFLGSGGGYSYINAIAIDNSGNTYVTGYSLGSWGTSPVNSYSGNTDIFIAKLDTNGNLTWHTFLGSSTSDYGGSISLDSSGNIYITGYSWDTWGTPVNAHISAANYDAVVAKLNNNGVLQWNTFMGSANADYGKGIKVDSAGGNIYLVGSSNQTWGTPIEAHASPGSAYDGFAARLNGSGVLQWNTFMGSTAWDSTNAISTNGSNLYITGSSEAGWGSGAAAFTGNRDAFVLNLNTNGIRQWNTFLGSANADNGLAITTDGNGNILVAGNSETTWGTPKNAHAGTTDAFAAQLNNSGTLLWNTFMGASAEDSGQGIAAVGSAVIYLTGSSNASWGNPVNGHSGNYDAFAVRLEEADPEIDVQRPAGTSIADGGTDAQGTKRSGEVVTLTYTVENTGNSNLTISNITTASLTNVSVGTISPTNFTVSAGGNNTFNVPYTPAAGSGAFNFDLNITSNDSDEENYHITISGTRDGTAPFVTINQGATQPDPTNSSPIIFDVIFSEAVAGFAQSDVNITGIAGIPGITVTGSDANYSVAVTGMVDGETVTASIPANAAQDTTGNENTASASTDNSVTYDDTAPTVLYGTNTIPENNAVLSAGLTQIQIEFSEDVTTTSAEDETNYLLLEAGTNGIFDSNSCATGVLGDDREISINTATYNNNTIFVTTLDINNAIPLPAGTYRLLISGTTSIDDLVGIHLNDGADSLLDFTIEEAASSLSSPSILPDTGFPHGRITSPPQQPVAKAYTQTTMTLQIPEFGVSMPIIGVPQSKNGWDVTWLGSNAGYLYGSAFPTWAGNTVITGHVWNAFNQPGPFARIKTLKYGDQIQIQAWNLTYTYEVRESKLLTKKAIKSAFRSEEDDWLTLVTCELYNPLNGEYLFRRVVKAVLVSVD